VKKNASLARKVAVSCRILGKLGLFKETTGHGSARRDQMMIRGRDVVASGPIPSSSRPGRGRWVLEDVR
jgi:hypothetical protein